MKRRVSNLLAAVSLVLCISTFALWVRSYWWEDCVIARRDGAEVVWHRLYSNRGGLSYEREKYEYRDGAEIGPRLVFTTGRAKYSRYEQMSGGSKRQLIGFAFHRADVDTEYLRDRDWEIILPYWFIALLAAAMPGWWVGIVVAEQRRRGLVSRNRCTSCGYDMRATPDRCPECGTAVGPAA